MPVRIRLQRKGRKKRPFYHIVVADARAKRDGRMIERLGSYNPLTVPATIELDRDRAFYWVMTGAQPTQTVKAILRFKGIYYRKHLMRGVAKGALTEEEAMAKYKAWIEEKEAKIAKRREETARKRDEFNKMIDGVAPPKKEKVVETAETPAAESKPEEPKTLLESVEKTEIDVKSGEIVAPTEEAPAEEAPAAEAPAEEASAEETPAEETPAAEAPKTTAKAPKQDDLKVIEGIGPKISELLIAAGIDTWEKLANAEVDQLKSILAEAGSRYAMHNPTTWPQQAQLCVEGKWDELKELQDRLDGGVEKS